MGEQPEPPALDDVDELDGHWTKDTTITVNRITKARLDRIRDDLPWDAFLEKLRREHADPLTMNDGEQIVDYLESQLDSIDGDNSDVLEEIKKQLDRIETAQGHTVEEGLTMSADVDESEIARMVVADLKAELPEAIAEELR